jgi:hypothetical protein
MVEGMNRRDFLKEVDEVIYKTRYDRVSEIMDRVIEHCIFRYPTAEPSGRFLVVCLKRYEQFIEKGSPKGMDEED